MSYGLKYELLSRSVKGNNDMVRIRENGYSGPQIDRDLPINPFRLVKDRAPVIKGTSLIFLMRERVDFEFIPMFSSPARHYLIELYRNNNLLWCGFLNTQQYASEYRPAPIDVSFMAYDGLALLRDEWFDMIGRQSLLSIIRYCIDKTGLSLGYSIAVSVHETRQATDRSPFEQTYVDCKIFEDDDCYTVLEKILLILSDAQISQVGGRWEIVSSRDKRSPRMLYDASGNYEGMGPAPGILTLGYPDEGDVYPLDVLNFLLQFGGYKVFFRHVFGRRESIFRNYNFELFDWTALEMNDWSFEGTATQLQKIRDGDFFLWISGRTTLNSDFVQQTQYLENIPGEAFVFSVDMCPVGFILPGGGRLAPVEMEVRAQVTQVVGVTTYYLTETGWSTSAGYITLTVESAMFVGDITWHNVKIITDALPGNGNLTVKLMKYLNASPGPNTTYAGVAFHDVEVAFLSEDTISRGVSNKRAYDSGSMYQGVASFPGSSGITALPDIEIYAADAPDKPNKSLMYDNITRLADGTPTEDWQMSGDDSNYSLIEVLLRLLAFRNRRPLQLLSGTIKGSDFVFNRLIRHPENSNREFAIVEGTWNLYNETFTGTIEEVPAYTEEAVIIDDGTIVGGADLEVVSIALSTVTIGPYRPLNVTVKVGNDGTNAGSGRIEWKIVDTGGATIRSGEQGSGNVNALGEKNVVFEVYSPSVEGTYHIEARMSGDDTWRSSANLNVQFIYSIESIGLMADGAEGTPMTITMAYDNPGAAGNYPLFWEIRKSGTPVSNGSFTATLEAGSKLLTFDKVMYPPADTGLRIYLSPSLGGSETESRQFDSVAVVMSLGSVPDQSMGGSFSGIYLTVASPAAISLRMYWRVRNQYLTVVESGSTVISIASGANSYLLNGTMPSSPGDNFDLQVGRTSECDEATSNKFSILAM